MPFRDDVVVDWSQSPRIITVLAPSREIVLQDLVDTLRELESQPAQMDDASIISAAGKENLGGGITVGITATLLNAQISFQARTTPDEDGLVTTGGTTTFTDTGADFVAAGVVRGSVVVNYTDGSVADVRNVLSSTELETVALEGGTSNTFSINDDYSVFNVDQVNIQGGNLVAVDEADLDISPVLPTFGTQVVRTSSSSATLQELEIIQFSSYNGGVTVDTSSSNTGTEFPVGTLQAPVNNFTDALAIQNERGFDRFFVLGDATIDTGLDYTNKIFEGQGMNLSTFTLTAAANLANTEFIQATIQGTLDGDTTLQHCRILTLDFVTGVITDCILSETVTLMGSTPAQFINCTSGVPGTATPTIDMGGDGPPLTLRNYSGGIELVNKTGNAACSIDMLSGQVIISPTVTTGTITVRGLSKLVDNSGGATIASVDLLQPAVVNDSNSRVRLIEKFARNRLETNPSTGILTLYDDDNTTVLFTGQLYEDVNQIQTYRGQGAERRNRLT